jgi:16S rRNA (guanine527-N7)-methyltransferase
MFHVKHSDDSTLSLSAIQDAALRCGVRLDELQAEAIRSHAAMVVSANERLNLTRITEPQALLRLHIVDSLIWMKYVEGALGSVIDIGSGAGYPGIPVAIATGAPMTLCESIKKKSHFLIDVVSVLGLAVTVYPDRAEELARVSPAAADTVVARAVSSLSALIELAAPLLTMGGRLVALKGTIEPSELQAGEHVAQLCGLTHEGVTAYVLPGGDEARSVAVYRRTGGTVVPLPRRAGLAQRRPLGQ